MYMFYLGLEWLSRHPVMTTLGAFVVVTTIAIVWYFDHYRYRDRHRRHRR